MERGELESKVVWCEWTWKLFASSRTCLWTQQRKGDDDDGRCRGRERERKNQLCIKIEMIDPYIIQHTSHTDSWVNHIELSEEIFTCTPTFSSCSLFVWVAWECKSTEMRQSARGEAKIWVVEENNKKRKKVIFPTFGKYPISWLLNYKCSESEFSLSQLRSICPSAL